MRVRKRNELIVAVILLLLTLIGCAFILTNQSIHMASQTIYFRSRSNISRALIPQEVPAKTKFLQSFLQGLKLQKVIRHIKEEDELTVTGQPYNITERNQAFKNVLLSNPGLGLMATSIQESMIRSGIGLEPYTTERREKAWIENGVVYRPYRGPYEKEEKFPSPFNPEYEAFVPYNHSTFFMGRNHSLVHTKDKKIILWWQKPRYMPRMKKLWNMRACPDFPCMMTTWRPYMDKAAAVVFAGELIRGPPPPRRPEQVFIFNNHEPPVDRWINETHIRHANYSHAWQSAFNWTMTYRIDSDIVSYYGLVRRRPESIPGRDWNFYKKITQKKTRLAAWIVSNCNSPGGRDKYVRELSRYVPVDIYGDCGTYRCPRGEDSKCIQLINDTYKFYISFENSISTDYLSEKFFKCLSANVIVIARASDDFNQHAPSDIFLNTARFSSPRALADRMLYLDKNPDEYARMLQEKDKYMTIFEDYPIRAHNRSVVYMTYHYEAVPFCEVCQRVWNLEHYQKTIPDIVNWLDSEPIREPVDLHF